MGGRARQADCGTLWRFRGESGAQAAALGVHFFGDAVSRTPTRKGVMNLVLAHHAAEYGIVNPVEEPCVDS